MGRTGSAARSAASQPAARRRRVIGREQVAEVAATAASQSTDVAAAGRLALLGRSPAGAVPGPVQHVVAHAGAAARRPCRSARVSQERPALRLGVALGAAASPTRGDGLSPLGRRIDVVPQRDRGPIVEPLRRARAGHSSRSRRARSSTSATADPPARRVRSKPRTGALTRLYMHLVCNPPHPGGVPRLGHSPWSSVVAGYAGSGSATVSVARAVSSASISRPSSLKAPMISSRVGPRERVRRRLERVVVELDDLADPVDQQADRLAVARAR